MLITKNTSNHCYYQQIGEAMARDLSVFNFPAFRFNLFFFKKKRKGFPLQSGLKNNDLATI
jgi:hypothetical protein